MRTTVDLPPDLFRRAKARAGARGESLKALLARAVAGELGHTREAGEASRVALPLFGTSTGPSVDLTSADLACALAADDVRAAAPRRRRGRR